MENNFVATYYGFVRIVRTMRKGGIRIDAIGSGIWT
jgi:hypothetical protein